MATKLRVNEDQHRVDLATFQWPCVKLKARQSQVHSLDVSDAVFGTSAPFEKLPKRILELVDRIIDDYLSGGGHCVKAEGNKIFLLFPELSKSLGELKAHAIAEEIRRTVLDLVNGSTESGATQQTKSPSISTSLPVRFRANIQPRVDGTPESPRMIM